MTGDVDLCRAFLEAHPGEAASVLERLDMLDAVSLLESMPPGTSAQVLAQMTPSVADGALSRMQPAAAAALVAELRLDQGAALLRRVDDSVRARLLEHLPGREADALRALLRYPPQTAGALMDPRVFAVGEDATVADTIGLLRRSPASRLDDIYVIDGARRLIGAIGSGELLSAPPAAAVHGLARSLSPLRARMDRPAILAHPDWRQHAALPVVDEQWQLVGVIRLETFRALEDAARGVGRRPDAAATVFALGELYWLGLSGVVDALASAVRRSPTRPGRSEAGRANA